MTAWRASRGGELWSNLERDSRVVGVPLRDNLGRDVGSLALRLFPYVLRRYRSRADRAPGHHRCGGSSGDDPVEHPRRDDHAARPARRAALPERVHGRNLESAAGRACARPGAGRPSRACRLRRVCSHGAQRHRCGHQGNSTNGRRRGRMSEIPAVSASPDTGTRKGTTRTRGILGRLVLLAAIVLLIGQIVVAWFAVHRLRTGARAAAQQEGRCRGPRDRLPAHVRRRRSPHSTRRAGSRGSLSRQDPRFECGHRISDHPGCFFRIAVRSGSRARSAGARPVRPARP